MPRRGVQVDDTTSILLVSPIISHIMQSAQQHCYICRDILNALSEYYPNLSDSQLETPLLYANIWRAENDYYIMICLEDIQWNKLPFDTRSETSVTEIYMKPVSKDLPPGLISLGNCTDIENCGAIIKH